MLFKKILPLSLFMSLSVGASDLNDDEIKKIMATLGISRSSIVIMRQTFSDSELSNPHHNDHENHQDGAMDPDTVAMYQKAKKFYQNEKPTIPHPNLASQTFNEEDLESDPEEILGDNHDNVNEETEVNHMLLPD